MTFGPGELASEEDGEVIIRWEFWSDKSDESIVNLSLLKSIKDPERRQQVA